MTTAQSQEQTVTRDSGRESASARPAIAFRPDIEGLRAVAVLLVVAGHAGVPFFSGGFVGVDVFFVISGFLITTLLLKELDRSGTISIKGFYARRATRLLPASAVVLVATLVAAWLWLPSTRLTSIAADAVASSFYAINYRLAFTETDYFNADAAPSPMQHFWSLAVEEQFYFVWPLLLLGVGLLALRRGRLRRGPITAALLVIGAGSLTLSILQSPVSTSWSYFGIHTRAWELATGALIAVFAATAANLPRAAAATATWTGIGMILTAAFTFTDHTVFPGYAAILPVAGTALAIAGGCAQPSYGAGLLLDRSPMQFIGKLSYGYYLWHWPVLLIAPAALDRTPTLTFNLAAMAGALALTWATYHLVENPIRTRRSLKTRPWRGITLGTALTATTATTAITIALIAPMAIYTGKPATDTSAAMAQPNATITDLKKLILTSQRENVIPANLEPALEEVEDDRPVVYDDGCNLELDDKRTRNQICEYGDTDSDTTVVLFGDSHAAQWFPAVDEIAKQRGWKLVPITRSGCAVATVDIVHEVLGRRYTECGAWRDNAFDIVKELQPRLVITTSINGHKPVDADNQPLDNPDQVMRDGWDTTFDNLQSDTTDVAYLIDTPNFGQVVPDCVATNQDTTQECAVEQDEAMLRPERTRLVTDMAEARDITVIDPVGWFCAQGTCPPIIGNMLVIRDSNHITTPYVRTLTPLLEAQLPSP